MPSNAVDFTSLASFKRSISSIDFSQYLIDYSLCLSIGCVVYLYLIFISFLINLFSFFSGQLLVLLSLSVRLTLCCVTLIFVLCIRPIHFEQ